MPRDFLFLLHFWPILSASNAFPITTVSCSFITVLQNAASVSTKKVRNNKPEAISILYYSFRVYFFYTQFLSIKFSDSFML